jgi:hypothetical protein
MWQSNPAVGVGEVLCQVFSIQRLDTSASSSVLTQGRQQVEPNARKGCKSTMDAGKPWSSTLN